MVEAIQAPADGNPGLLLPDGTPTKLLAGDTVVWEKTTGEIRFQRVGVGTLRAPWLETNPLPTTEEFVKEVENTLTLYLAFLSKFMAVKLIDESSTRAVVQVVAASDL